MLTIRPAVPEELPAILAMYDRIIDRFQAQTGTTAWQKGVYPTEEYLQTAIRDGTLYIGALEGKPVAGMVITQGTDKTYGSAPWRIDAKNEETAVIHTLGVSPGAGERDAGLQMVEGAIALAREKGWKALRLDVLEGNTAALRLYERAGFSFIAAKTIWYESTGTANFLLYEYVL